MSQERREAAGNSAEMLLALLTHSDELRRGRALLRSFAPWCLMMFRIISMRAVSSACNICINMYEVLSIVLQRNTLRPESS